MEPGLERFAVHTERLASHYTPYETYQFVSAFSLVYGSIPHWKLTSPMLATARMLDVGSRFAEYPALVEGAEGWISELVDGNNPSHHYAGLFYTGYWFGSGGGIVANWLRDGPISGNNTPDILLGNIASRHGWSLAQGNYSMFELGNVLRARLGTEPSLIPGHYP